MLIRLIFNSVPAKSKIKCAAGTFVSRSADTSPYTGEPLGRCDAEGEMKLA